MLPTRNPYGEAGRPSNFAFIFGSKVLALRTFFYARRQIVVRLSTPFMWALADRFARPI